jgi:IclR family acetate operon transcriptional repressor
MAQESRESSFVGMLTGGGQVQYLAKSVSPNEVRYDASLEHLRPIHCTSMGLVIVAYAPERDVARWLHPSRMVAVTEHRDGSRKNSSIAAAHSKGRLR